MDKIDQRLDDLYRNWHAEYGNVITIEECDEIKKGSINPFWKNMNPNIGSYTIYCSNQA